MGSVNVRKKIVLGPTARMIIGAALIFIAVLLFMPQAGVFRTVPFLLFAGIASGLLNVKTVTCASLTGIFNMCVYSIYVGGVVDGIVYSVLAVVYVVIGVYIAKLVVLVYNTKKPTARKKALVICVLCFAVVIVLSLIFCGNTVSFIKKDADNTNRIEYLNKHYGEYNKVIKKYTSYFPVAREYRTYVTFKDDGNIVGANDDCYISVKNDNLTDCVRIYYENKMLADAKKSLANIVKNTTNAFEVTAANIVFQDEEILDGDSKYLVYQNRIGYVVSFYSIIENKNDFLSLCYDTALELAKNGFEYNEVIFCGGTSSNVLFCVQVTPGITYDELFTELTTSFDELFDSGILEKYGVSEEMILGYWNNI